ncbi:phosphatidylglycerol lysyltransferase domain-containing protein [Stappia sp.]|uniref:phosphatidylglycerol lysyltransferase domain-containing protein n=1 Tax=Stappia sp. TaxID=1870903 RepID=UPI003C7EB799
MSRAHAPAPTPAFNVRMPPVLQRLTDFDLGWLQRVLDRHQTNDPYQASATYYAMTGRDGVWLAKDETAQSAAVVCQHPNLSNSYLVFPPIGARGDALVWEVMKRIAATGADCQVARANEALVKRLSGSSAHGALVAAPERVLDWAYPVHTLDTAKLAAHRGGDYEPLRRKLNKLDMDKVTAIEIAPDVHRNTIEGIVALWSHGDRDKSAPYQRLLDLFGAAPLSGRLHFFDGEPAGFSIWEQTTPETGMANAFAHIGLREIPGLSQYVMVDMCRTLEDRGYSRVCIGGSETAGLDQFKRQLRPVRSVSVGTWRYVPELTPRRTFEPGSADTPRLSK